MSARCENCRFWGLDNDEPPFGDVITPPKAKYCTRFPEFILHHKNDHCGEHRPKEPNDEGR